jgi:hypothetical protein
MTPTMVGLYQFSWDSGDASMEAMSCSMDGMCSCSSMESCSCSMDMSGAMSCNHDADDGPSFCGCSAPQQDWVFIATTGLKAVLASLPWETPRPDKFLLAAEKISIPPVPFLKKHKPPA